MSPKISVSVSIPLSTVDRRPPRNRVIEAMHHARAEGAPLAFSPDPGVKQAAFTNGWVIDRSAKVPGVNILGALLLQWQPQSKGDEDPSATLARDLNVSLGYIEGVADGWCALPSTFWLTRSEGKHYRAGLECGYEARLYATLACEHCGSRRLKTDGPHCPGCDP
jgi:hypothetical protein